MWITAITSTLSRDLRTLRREVEAYPEEHQIWQEIPGVINTAGTLVLHLTGNVQHYIGMHLGGSSYVRDRPAEFSRRNVKRSELLERISAAEAAVRTLSQLDEKRLDTDFPEAIGGHKLKTAEFLVHIVAHFTYHLGQIDYHRRAATGNSKGVDAVRPIELSTARPVPS